MNKLFCASVVVALLCVLAGPANAQRGRQQEREPLEIVEVEAPDTGQLQPSVFLFDVRYDQIVADLESQGISTRLFDQWSEWGLTPIPGISDMRRIRRIYGAFAAPKNGMASLNDNSGATMFDFFIRYQLTDRGDCDAVFARLDGYRHFERIEMIAGKPYHVIRPGTNGFHGFIYLHRVDESTIEVGSPAYCLADTRNFSSPVLRDAFSRTTNGDIRVAADTRALQPLMTEAIGIYGRERLVQLAGEVGAPAALVDLHDDTEMMYGSIDFSDGPIMDATFVFDDEDDSRTLQAFLTSQLDVIKEAGNEPLPYLVGVPGVTDVMEGTYMEALNQTSILQNGSQTDVRVPRPGSFPAMIAAVDRRMAELKAFEAVRRKKEIMLRVYRSIDVFEYVYNVYPFQYTREDLVERARSSESSEISPELSWRGRLWAHPVCHEHLLAGSRAEFDSTIEGMRHTVGPDEHPNSLHTERMPAPFALQHPRQAGGGTHSTIRWIQTEIKTEDDIPDGAGNTIMLMEYPDGKPWLINDPLSIDEAVELATSLEGNERLVISFYNGEIRILAPGNDPTVIRQMCDPSNHDVESAAAVREQAVYDER
ncbi:MAG: hypothetical protein AAF456_13460 [Planctomycetota bacterium]